MVQSAVDGLMGVMVMGGPECGSRTGSALWEREQFGCSTLRYLFGSLGREVGSWPVRSGWSS